MEAAAVTDENVLVGKLAAHSERISLLIAEPDRAAQIANLHANSFEAAWDRAQIDTLLSAETAIAFVSTLGGGHDAVGFVIGRLLVDEAEIITVGVGPEYRRRGIGQELLGAFERAAATAGAKLVVLEVAEDNSAALRMYGTAGYSEAGVRPAYYKRVDGPAIDAKLLAKEL